MSRRLLAAAVLVVLAGGLGAYGGAAMLRVSAMQREMETMERDIVTLRARTEALTQTVERLRTDPAYLEKIAREELGWVREGETVLKFPSTAR